MKSILMILLGSLLMGACSAVPVGDSCKKELTRPSYFLQGENLVAFRVSAHAKQYIFDGILQIKRRDAQSYEAVLFATAGAYQVARATVTRDAVQYTFLTPLANRASVRKKLQTLLLLLLFPPVNQKSCQAKEGNTYVTYQDRNKIIYEYPSQEVYPQALTYKKMFSSVRLEFMEYMPDETGFVPNQLFYKDGIIEVNLQLLLLKK